MSTQPQYTVKTRRNASAFPVKGESNNGLSLTVPDMTYTPQELLIRARKGLTMPKLNALTYHGDINDVDPRSLDLVELHERIDLYKQRVIDAQAKLKAKQQQRDEKRAQALKDEQDWKKQMNEFMSKKANTNPSESTPKSTV